jgi:hypothetical protein
MNGGPRDESTVITGDSSSFSVWIRRRRGLVFAVPAGAFAVLMVVAAMNLDQGAAVQKRESRIKDAQSLLSPQVASAEELRNASGSLSNQTAIKLSDGAWVQVADETGRLSQQYSAARLEPMPASKLRMTEPRARMFLRDGRVMALAARDGLVSVPRRALESGTLEGEVEIRLFKPVDGREIDVLRDTPALVINADEAQFDAIAGEVRCNRAVRIETDAGSFAGEGLTLVLDSDGAGVERLLVDRALEPIRIDRAARAVAAKRRGPKPAPIGSGIIDAPPLDRVAKPVDAVVSANTDAPSAATPSPATPSPAIVSPAIASPAPEPVAPPRFYRLVLTGGVEVVRVRSGVVSTIRGDELIAIFSLESQGLDELAFVPAGAIPADSSGTSMIFSRNFSGFAASPALAVGALVFATQQANVPASTTDSSSDSVTVSFGGRLEMVPVTDPADQLATRDDIRFDVVGPRVELIDGRSSARVVCSRLRYSVRDERVEADGRAGMPLTVSSPRMTMEGGRFWASFSEGVGRLEGPGRMAFARGAARDVSWLEIVPTLTPDAARMLVSADPAAVAMVLAPVKTDAASQSASQSASPAGSKSAGKFDATAQDLEITWKGGVDLRFAGGSDNTKISGARFEGGVNVFGQQFELLSKSLEVAFSAKDSERIDSIIAQGETRVRQLGAEGAMNADRLELFLGLNKKGDSVPTRLNAHGSVEAKDARQTIWTEDLVVTFSEKKPISATNPAANPATNPAADPAAKGAIAEPSLGAIDVNTVEAKGGVQVLLGEGARVFAETLTGNAIERKLRLTGDNVAIVRSNIIADNLRDLRFDDATHSARSEGPGRFRAFRKPITVGEGRIERPDPNTQASLDASWTGELDYQEASAVKGTLDIRGDVKLRSRPSDMAADAVDAKSVLLDIGIEKGASTANSADAARALNHFLARGNARIESRLWTDAAHSGEPRIFRVTGEHIEYDMITREGLVVGDGGLLVNIPFDAEAAKNEDAKAARIASSSSVRAATPIALGAEGTTRFTWKQRMALERIVDDRYLVRMNEQVELLHAGPREADKLSMRCDNLEANVRRPEGGKMNAAKSARADGGDAGVDLGGPAELLGVKGTGNVFIRTPAQDLECGEFDYSVLSGIATLRAAQGRAVTVVFANTPTPLQAQEIEWDLRLGRLEIKKPLLTGGR